MIWSGRLSGHLWMKAGDHTTDRIDVRIQTFHDPDATISAYPATELGNQPLATDGFMSLAVPLPEAYAAEPLWLQLSVRLPGESEWEILTPRIEYLALANADRGRIAHIAESAAPSSIDSATFAGGSLDQSVFAPNVVQQRLDAACPDGEVLRQILPDGSRACTTIPVGAQGPVGPRGPTGAPAGSFAICRWSTDTADNFCSRWCGTATALSQALAPCTASSDGGGCALGSPPPSGGCCSCRVQ